MASLGDTVGVQPGYVEHDVHALVHALYGDVLVRAVEGIASGAEVGAGQAAPGEQRAVGAAAYGLYTGSTPAALMAFTAFSTR